MFGALGVVQSPAKRHGTAVKGQRTEKGRQVGHLSGYMAVRGMTLSSPTHAVSRGTELYGGLPGGELFLLFAKIKFIGLRSSDLTQRGRHREKETKRPSMCWFTPPHVYSRQVPASPEAWELGSPSRGPKHLNHPLLHSQVPWQGAGSQEDQSGLKPAPRYGMLAWQVAAC